MVHAKMSWMTDILLPTTDGGVFAQVGLLFALGVPALWLSRKNRDVLIFVTGVVVFAFALIASRGLH